VAWARNVSHCTVLYCILDYTALHCTVLDLGGDVDAVEASTARGRSCDPWVAGVVQEDVGGLDVAVHDAGHAALVQVGEAAGHARRDAHARRPREGLAAAACGPGEHTGTRTRGHIVHTRVYTPEVYIPEVYTPEVYTSGVPTNQ